MNMSEIKCVSYNCRGLPKNSDGLHTRPDIIQLFNNAGILAFQETWWAKQELHLGNTLHEDFLSFGVASVDYSAGILQGRPYGGVNIFYHKRFAQYVRPIYFENCNWCAGIEFNLNDTCFSILFVYLPFECIDNEDEYIEKLSILESYVDSLNHGSYAIIGDFNANIASLSSKFAKYINEFSDRNDFIMSSKILLPNDSYTYISDRWGTTSWLDYAISSTDFHECIKNLKVEYNLTYSDHIPFSFDIRTSFLPRITITQSNNDSLLQNKIAWRKFTPEQCDIYHTFTDLYCHSKNLQNSLPVCNDCNCSQSDHRSLLIDTYNDVINCLNLSAEKAQKPIRRRREACQGKPGWAQYVKHKHDAAFDAYQLWRDNGKPHHGPYFDNHKKCKLNYKYAVRAIKRNIETIKADNVASNLINNNYNGFWNAVRKYNNVKEILPQQVGKTTGEKEICSKWKEHFSTIYNSVCDSADVDFHNVTLRHVPIDSDVWFTESQFLIAVLKLENNKSSGRDVIFAEHIKYCSLSMLRVICKLFNSFLLHGFLPKSFMSVLIKPVYKKSGSINDMSSYRPIALANCFSKLFEAILRDKLLVYLNTCVNQFGYKRKTGTDFCLYTFKEIIDRYNNANSNVYCCFLDASKAYDRVSHKTIFNMLVVRNVPLIFIRLLAYWYKHQTLAVKWGTCISECFSVSNGVRQGSVLSPYLFCIYVDKISECLNCAGIGCKIKNLLINHLFYADDLVLFSPSSRGLQTLLNICNKCALDLDIIFNETKCKVMVFKTAMFRKCINPIFYLGQHDLKECISYKYLGHFITENRSDDCDIARQCRSIYAKGNSLIRKFHSCSDEVKVTLFKAHCSSLYSSYLWSRYTQSAFRKLTVAYHGVLKKFLNFPRCTSNSLLFVFYGVPTFQEIYRKYISGFRNRILNSDNALIVDLLNSNGSATSSLHRRWFSLLH